jgi:hypothetical protein
MAGQSLQLAITKNSTLASRPRDELKSNQIEPEMVMENFLRPGTYYQGWDGVLVSIFSTTVLHRLTWNAGNHQRGELFGTYPKLFRQDSLYEWV